MKRQRCCRSPGGLGIVILMLAAVVIATLAACGGPYYYGSVTFVDSQHGWVTGWDNADTPQTVVYGTSDGGATWTQAGSHEPGGGAHVVGWVEFSTPTSGVWCVDKNSLLFTTTGGGVWSEATITGMPASSYFTAASFATATVGWASAVRGVKVPAQGGVIHKTSDGGATWYRQKVVKGGPNTGGFVDVDATSELTCYALKDGESGGVWATHDGGTTWTRHRLPGTSAKPVYDAIDFVSDSVGWAVGSTGKIAKTSDGGINWMAQASHVKVRLRGVCFVSDSVGWAVGDKGCILATLDGGTHWVRQTSGTTAGLRVVDFVSPAEGWAVGRDGWVPGDSGVLRHTTDGGLTWH